MKEVLDKAVDRALFLVDELRAAHKKGSALESLILLPMIEQAVKLARDIAALKIARRTAMRGNNHDEK